MSLEYTMGATGLTSLKFNGLEMLYAAGNTPTLIEMYGRTAHAHDGSQWLGNQPVSVVTDPETVTLTYDWGTVHIWYRAHCDMLYMNVTVANDTPATIFDRYRLFPLALAFPQNPADMQNTATFNKDGPSAVFRDYGTGAVDLCNEEPEGALGLGFWQVNNPPDNKWFLQMFVDPTQSINPNWPTITRPVRPGESITFRTSIRFGPQGATEHQLAGDIFRQYRTAFPSLISATPAPRQPIARLSFNGAFRPTYPTNPRGWFNSQTVNVTTPEGITNFQNGLMSSADSCVQEMTRCNALGGIVWDIEGQQLDESYVGDPAQAEICAPEIIGIFDQFMRKLKNAGFQTGFTLRPQKFDIRIGRVDIDGTQVTWKSGAKFNPEWANAPGARGVIAVANNSRRVVAVDSPECLTLAADAGQWTDTEYIYATQTNTSHFEEMRAKIQYAYRRWGATLYYVDSTLRYNGDLTPGADFEWLREEYPDVMVFPEWKGVRHYSSTWPWTDTNLGAMFPGRQTMLTYPHAAGLIRVPNDEQIDAKEEQLTEAVRTGNILLFDGWYPHHANDVVIRCYQNAA